MPVRVLFEEQLEDGEGLAIEVDDAVHAGDPVAVELPGSRAFGPHLVEVLGDPGPECPVLRCVEGKLDVARSEDSECEQADQEVARVLIAEQRVAGLLEIDPVGDEPPLGGGPIDCLWIGAARLTARDEIREPLTASSRSTSSLPT